MAEKRTPRDISYAYAARSRLGKAMIRGIENFTGRPRLIRMALGYEDEVARGRDFWEVMTERYNVRMDLDGEGLEGIPETGPLLLVANHPFGILDGMAMGRMLAMRRPEFRILAHKVFNKARDLDRVVLPVSFDEDRAAQRLNLETRRKAMDFLMQGGAIGIFPGGTVSTAPRPFAHAMDPSWRNFTAKLAARSGATVVPMFFHGGNSRLFNLVAHIHPTLRVALMIREFGVGLKAPVRATIGKPFDQADLAARAGDPVALMDYMRDSTYALSPTPVPSLEYGMELEPQHMGRVRRAA